ncbi:hypothetical protein HJC10_03580 [Corallococcus exiguus]|nr:hypothetical protein [Corallococcus exiguus]
MSFFPRLTALALVCLVACSSVSSGRMPGIPDSAVEHCEKSAATLANSAPEAQGLDLEKRMCLEVRLQERCLSRLEKFFEVRKKRPDAPEQSALNFPGEWDHALAGDTLSDLNEHPACKDSKIRRAAMEAENAIGARIGDRWEIFGNKAVNRSREPLPTFDFASFIPAKASDFGAPHEAQEVWTAWRDEAISEARAAAANAYLAQKEGRLDVDGAKCLVWTRFSRASGGSISLIDARAYALGEKVRKTPINGPAWVKNTSNKIQDEAEERCDDSGNIGVKYMNRIESDAQLAFLRSEADAAFMGMLRFVNNAQIYVEAARTGGLSPANIPLPFLGMDLVEKYRPHKGYDGPL